MNRLLNRFNLASKIGQLLQRLAVNSNVSASKEPQKAGPVNIVPVPKNDVLTDKPNNLKTVNLSRYEDIDRRVAIFEEACAKNFRRALESQNPALDNFVANIDVAKIKVAQLKPEEVKVYIPNVESKIAEIKRGCAKNKMT